MTTAYFHFAIPKSASRDSRQAAPQHIAERFGITGAIQFVSEEPKFRLYRIKHEVKR